MKATLDRIEGSYAVLLVRHDERIKINMPMVLMPLGSKEGDIVDITITIDKAETQAQKQRTANLIEKLKRKNTQS